MCRVLWTAYSNYLVKFCPATFIHGKKKVNFTFINDTKVFLSIVFNGKKLGRTKKEHSTIGWFEDLEVLFGRLRDCDFAIPLVPGFVDLTGGAVSVWAPRVCSAFRRWHASSFHRVVRRGRALVVLVKKKMENIRILEWVKKKIQLRSSSLVCCYSIDELSWVTSGGVECI